MARKGRKKSARKSRTIVEPRDQAFVDGIDSYQAALKRAYKDEKASHLSLLRVVDIYSRGAGGRLSAEGLLAAYGLSAYSLKLFSAVDEEYAQHSYALDGGHMSVVEDSNGLLSTVVFMRNRTGIKAEIGAAIKLALFYHEIGHVDDFERGINLILGQSVDLENAELYAHQFTCRKLMERSFKLPLAFYLGDAINQLMQLKSESIQKAATRFRESADYTRFERFAGPLMDTYRMAL